MTSRAVILGLLAAVAIAALGYLNDWVLRLHFLVANHLPVSVYGLAIVTVLAANPALGVLCGRWRFDQRELAVMLALALVGGGLGGAGLFRNFPIVLAAPLQIEQRDPGWQRTGAVNFAAPALLPRPADAGQYDRTIGVLTDGLREPTGGHVGLRDVPWSVWARPLAFWGPLIALLLGGMIALGLVLHRQWSRHELLSYPIAELASTLIDGAGGGWPAVFRRRGFWWAFSAVLGIHLINGMHVYQPRMIEAPLRLDLSMLAQTFPWLAKSAGGGDLMYPELYLSAAAFVFFMRSDAAFSMGISTLLMAVVSGALIAHGVDFSGDQCAGGVLAWLSFGAYLGFAAMIVYTGRAWYGRLLRLAVWPRRQAAAPPYAVWAMRAFLACMAGVGALLGWAGCSWPVAILAVVLTVIVFLVVGRVSAETGLFHIGLIWSPLAALIGLMGARAAGLEALAAVGLLGAVLILDPRETLLPFVLNSLRLCQRVEAPVARTGRWMVVALAAGLLIGGPIVFWTQYNFGWDEDNWSQVHVPSMVFETLGREADQMRVAGTLEGSFSLAPLERLAVSRPSRAFLWSAGMALALVLVVGAARLRWAWWPIHPVLFVVWGTWAMQKLAPSILLGWLIRWALVKLGGHGLLRRAMPAVVGCIAGDLLGALTFMLYGAYHYATRGVAPPIYNPYTG